MSWILLAILAALIEAPSYIIDKFVLERYTKNAGALIIFFGIMNFIYSFFIFSFFQINIKLTTISLVALLSGSLLALAGMTKYAALGKEEVSRVSPLFATTPLVVTIIAKFAFGEVFSILTYFGIISIILGAFLLSFRIEKGLPKKIPVLGIIMIGILFFGLSNISGKWAQFTFDIWNFLFYNSFGYAIITLPLWFMQKHRTDFIGTFVKIPKALGAILLTESFSVIGISLFYYTLSLGPASLVSTLYSLRTFFIFLLATLISLAGATFLKEDLKGSTLLMKIVAIFLILGGVYLLASL